MAEAGISVQSHSAKYQYLAAAVVNIATVALGMFGGWNSPSILLLTSEDSPLPTGPLTMEEASWVASLHCLGGLFGNIAFAYIVNNFGRKLPLLFIMIPVTIVWILKLLSQTSFGNVNFLYVARLMGGFFAGGGGVALPLFLSEIAGVKFRGFLTVTCVLCESSGALIAYIIGAFFGFSGIPIFAICLTMVFVISMLFIPESPIFLVRRNKIEEAEKSIRFYKDIHGDDNDRKLIECEIDRLKGIIHAINTESTERSFDWSELKTKVAQKALIIGFVLVVLQQFSGVVAMLNYTAIIFQEAGSSLSPNISAIVIMMISCSSNLVATNLVDRIGRKPLIAISAMGTALGQIVLGIYMMLKSWNVDVTGLSWIPLASFSFVVFVSQLGILCLSSLLLSEIMPEKIKDVCVSFCMWLMSTFAFLAIKFLPMLTATLGFHGTMFLFSGICVGGAAFIISFMPETKCKTKLEIMKALG